MSPTILDARKRVKYRKFKTPELTKRQRDILAFVLHCWLRGHLPTVREVCSEFDIGWPNGALCHLRALSKKGFLVNDTNKRFQLTDKALELIL